jgi:secreted trypsin-like serine protease
MDGDGGRGEVLVDEDTCTGDSGGPMIIRKSATSPEDLQVR